MSRIPVRRFYLLLFLALAWLPGSIPALAAEEKRLALVVGIGTYRYAPALANPASDARAMGAELGRLGFAVDLVIDPDYRGLSTALREFGRKAADADLTLVFFAGHGVQVEGQNFLIPADAQLERERDLLYEALPLNLFLGELGQARQLGVMILDACRDNPFVERLSQSDAASAARVRAGLSRVDDTPSDTVIAMATRANAVADDGDGEHSPYTQALLEEFKVPGLELGLFFRRVRDAVIQATNGRQEPYTFGSYGAAQVYLNPLPPNRPPVVGAALPLQVVDNAEPTPLAIPTPIDPDQDQLVATVTGLPQGGTVMVGDRSLLIGDYLTVEQLKAASFRPDGSRQGEAGSFDYTVSDGRGGLTQGAVGITLVPSNHPPTIAAAPVLQVATNRLVLPAVSDPDGDPLTLRIRAVPEHGKLRQGKVVLEAGDRLDPKAGEPLTFDLEDAPPGPAGELAFTVEDGRGGEASGSVAVEVVPPGSEPAPASLDSALWRRLGSQAGEAELRAFLQLFPQSPFATEAQRRLAPLDIIVAGGGSVTPLPTPPKPPLVDPSPPPLVDPSPPPLVDPSPPPLNGRGMAGRFQDCPDCPVIVRIPAGSFIMGNNRGDRSERPAHTVTVAKPFGLGRYEVTVVQWESCVSDGGCTELPAMKGETDDTPVYNLTFSEASAYTTWLVRKTGQSYRLPSEAEWEYATRAGTTTPYWWGETVDGEHVVCRKCGSEGFDPATPPPVDSQPANPWGLVGMSGGVREWLADCWLKNYDKAPADTRPRLVRSCQQHVTRGGSWLDEPADLTVFSRSFYDAEAPYLANGFRVARDLE